MMMSRRARYYGGLVAAVVMVAMSCQNTPQPRADAAQDVSGSSEATVEAGGDTAGEAAGETPRRIILFIGDGMGLSAVAAASYVAARPLAMLDMAEFGVMATHEHEYVTTDSAASATAMATGEKTHFNGVSVHPSTGPEQEEEPEHQLRHIVDAASDAGWNSGVVATVRINHATPAPFAAHRHTRRSYEDIALDMSKSGLDVMLGAGYEFFRDRSDNRNLFAEMESRGFVIADDASDLRREAPQASQLVGLLHGRDMPWVDEQKREMELAEMVEHAIDVLDSNNPEGFFLMVEGAKIDWGGHRMDGERVVAETLDMDRAVQRALEYSSGRSDTLVAVTSDHETGAMDVIDGATASRYVDALGESDQAVIDKTIPDDIADERRDELAGPFARLDRDDGAFGPISEEGSQVVTSFGFMSAASRTHWDGEGRYSAIHTPELVPIFAEGTGARKLTRMRDNADLGRQLLGWIDEEEPDVEQPESLDESSASETPENVVVVATDGLGMASLTASYYHFGRPQVLEMPQMAAVSTHGERRLVNDRSTAAMSLFSGVRSDEVGVWEDKNVWNLAAKNGRAVGFVPSPTQRTSELKSMFTDHGTVFDGAGSGETALVDRVENAVQELSEGDDGFLLVVEAGGLGEAKTRMSRGDEVFSELEALDDAVEALRDFSTEDSETLMLVTSLRDHTLSVLDNHYGFHRGDCGAMAACGGDLEMKWFDVATEEIRHGTGLENHRMQGEYAPPQIGLQYTWMAQRAGQSTEIGGPFSANFVPLFAEGPGAGAFGGFVDQPDVGRWLVDWAGD